MTRRLFSVDETAAYLGLRPRTIRKWIFTGQLPVTRLGRRVLLDKKLLDTLIKEKTRPSATEESGSPKASGQVDDS